MLTVTATEVNVDAAAGNGEIAYSVENSVSGTTVSASTTATWITNFSYTTAGKVIFSVSANTGAERSAVVTLTYPGAAESKNVTVKQAAGQGGGNPGQPTTVTIKVQDYASTNSWVNGTQYNKLKLDDVITATVSGGGNTGKYYTSGYEWRIYQTEAPSLIISAAEGKTIETVKITYNVSNTGVLTLNSSNISSGKIVSVNATSVTFGVGNTGTKTNGQVKITAIEVVYNN